MSSEQSLKGKTGLENFGQTCYMNSALQCLSNVPCLREFFLNGKFKSKVNMDSRDGSKGEVVSRFAELLSYLWNGCEKEVKPAHLWVAIGRKNDMFKEPVQHDSQEFLSWLLDQLHEDLNQPNNSVQPSPANLAEESKDQSND
jgi:ubiquitin C-terminal hydrolase